MLNREKLLQALPAIERYASTVLAVICTLAIRLVLDPFLGDRAPYLFFLLTIVIVKRLWGRGPGLLATLLGGIAAWYFVLEPRFSFAIASRADALNLAAYFAIGAGISFLGEVSGHFPASLTVRGRNLKPRVIRQTAVLAGAAVVLAGMCLLLLRDFERARDARVWVAHTYRVMSSAESVMSMMRDAESGERGFLLTGDESYLAPYRSAIAALPRGLDELKDLTSDNPAQQARYVEINRLARERLSVLKHAIELRTNSNTDAALILVRYGRGEPSMDSLRSTLDAVMSEERRLLGERTAEATREDSRERWVLGLGSGALIILLVFASMVIERETVRREEITQALRRHTDLLEQAHDSLITWPLGGAIDYWSRGAETLYGYTREEALGRPSHELLKTHHPLGMTQVDALLERDGQWMGELTQTTKDRRELILDAVWTVAVDVDGRKTVLEANRDITDRKRAEEEVRLLNVELEQRVRSRTAELEAANRELEAFAHSVSHDLRAPLRGIDGWSLALLEDYGERLDEQGHKYLDRVRSEAQRMGRLIDDLLNLSRVGRAELIPRPVDLTSLAGTIVTRLKEANPGRCIEFIIAPQLKCTGDARLLEVALTNLLGNAVKFTAPRTPARVEFGKNEFNGEPAFFVRDNGVGFDMAYAGMLFAPFQRLHKTSEFPGTGIGLATVQRVVHRHGGRIWAEARVGAGATLYFTLGDNKP